MQAVTDGLLWGMDRASFRGIILASRVHQRSRFERVIDDMSVFSSLTPTQRASIADCLVLEVVEASPLSPLGLAACNMTDREAHISVREVHLGLSVC